MTAYFKQRMAEIGATRKRRDTPARQYVQVETTRHGATVYYYRKGDGPRIRLPDPGEVDPKFFRRAYEAAARGEQIALPRPKAAKRAPRGHVYFMRSGDLVKIGFSTNLRERQKSLRTARPEASFICKVVEGTARTERQFHQRFAAYRFGGEWFELRGALAHYLERDIHPVELPAKVEQPEPEPKGYL